MKGWNRKILGRLNDLLSGSKPEYVVRRLQIGMLVFTVLLVTFVLAYPSLMREELDLSSGGPWAVGRAAPSDVVAFTNIEFPRLDEYEMLKEEAENSTPLHFDRDSSVLTASEPPSARLLYEEDLAALGSCRQDNIAIDDRRRCIRNNISRWQNLGNAQLDALLEQTVPSLRTNIEQLTNLAFQNFVILDEPFDPGEFSGGTIRVRDYYSSTEYIESSLRFAAVVSEDDLFSPIVRNEVSALASNLDIDGADLRNATVNLVLRYLQSLKASSFNPERTEEARRNAVENITVPVYRINRGESILKRDEMITSDRFRALELHNRARFQEKIHHALAIFIQQAVLIGLLLYLANRFYTSKKLSDLSSSFIVFVTIWLFAGMLFIAESIWGDNSAYNERVHFFASWIPIGLFIVLLAVIFSEVAAMALGVYLSFLVFIASRYDGHSLLIALAIALVGAILGPRIKKRVQFIYTGLTLALIGIVLVSAGFLYGNKAILAGMSDGGFFAPGYKDAIRVQFISGLATVLVIALLPVYETIFNIPTRFKLSELADPSNPLLQEMFRRAPSTWTHTLMVAALSEKACERLKLNTVLTRTGVYYHDIGKMKNAGFFIENQHLIPRPENIDKNNPHKASRVIIDHVLDGIEMAKAARLPKEVIAFIPEHHGTSTMSFFYHKALEKMKRKVNKEAFRYPGPKPQSKETAIVMLADSLEAASRSLDEVNEATLDQLIQKIINGKLAENQLDESGLSFGEIPVIKQAFKDVLLSSFHFRPKYPDQASTAALEKSNNRIGKKTGHSATESAKKTAGKKKGTKKSQ